MKAITFERVCLLSVFLFLCSTTAQKDNSVVPLAIGSRSGYYCYLRCVAKCSDEHKVTSLGDGSSACSTDCLAYHTDQLCNETDTECWSKCKNLTDGKGSAPQAPKNLTVDYVTSPQPTPHEADLRWSTVSGATLYLIQYLDKTDEFHKWSAIDGNLSLSNVWRFRKPALCPEYSFRVATVNMHGVSAFSSSVDLAVPVPVVDNPGYKVIIAEVINRPFEGFSPDDPTYNSTVRIVIEYTPPPNWNLTTELIRVEPTFHIIELPLFNAEPVSPYVLPVPDKPQFEILLPGDVAYFDDKDAGALFLVDRMYTKCDPTYGYDYPHTPTGFRVQFDCKHVDGGICPGAEPINPYCNVDFIKPSFSCIDSQQTANVTVNFSPIDRSKRNATVLYYKIIYGPVGYYGQGNMIPTTDIFIFNETQITSSNDSTSFVIPHMDLNTSDIGTSICAIFDDRWARPSWNITWKFLVYSKTKTNACPIVLASNSAVVLVAVPTAFILLLALLVVIFLYARSHRRHTKRLAELDKHRRSQETENGYVDMPRLHDRWEIPKSHLILHEDQKLGSGAFGAVYKGRIRGRALMSKKSQSALAEEWTKAENCDVAVKMLPEYADECAKSEFRKEINLMKQVGYHERLVNMLCCVTAEEPLCLVVEFCSEGDLLHYLRDRCKYMVKLQENGVDLCNLPEEHDVDLTYILSIKDLLMFSWQICVGLEYLSEKNYIHRDVAARNVMVDAGKRAKIGDFGLCRYSCSDPIYMGKGGRLPWKWMALEAIKNYEFTTKSDVWSFGVLLFEIVTLGGTPYPGIDPGTMEKYLDDGNRLAQPDNCPDDFYSLMTDCWFAEPEKRATFSNLRERLSKQLEVITEDYSYLHLNQARDYYNMMQYNSRQQQQFDEEEAAEAAETISEVENQNEASTSFVNRGFAEAGDADLINLTTPDMRPHASVARASSYPASLLSPQDLRKGSGDSGIPSDAVSVISADENGHGSAFGGPTSMLHTAGGSDQMLISSASSHSPKSNGGASKLNKLFKLKHDDRLDTLPESTGSIGSRKQSAELGGSANPVYIEELLERETTAVGPEIILGTT